MTLSEAYDRRVAALLALQNAGKVYRFAEPEVREAVLRKARGKYQRADAEFRRLAAEENKA